MSGESDAVSSTTSRLAPSAGPVRSPATYWVAGSRSSSVQPAGAASTSPRRNTATPSRPTSSASAAQPSVVEALHAAERRDLVARTACARPSRGGEGQVGVRAGEGVPGDVVERVGHGHPRIRTDRQVTQPSSFSNSDTSTSVTV